MKIGIYNRWLHTMGGAERYTVALAGCLGQNNDVELLTHRAVALAELAGRLGVPDPRFSIRCLPELAEGELAALTASYDLFINACYMCSLPSRARRSLLIVYFPTPFTRSRKHLLRSLVALRPISLALGIPEYGEGFYPAEWIGRRVFRWTCGKASIIVPVRNAGNPLRLQVEVLNLHHDELRPARISFLVNGAEVTTHEMTGRRTASEFVEVCIPVALLRRPETMLKLVSETTHTPIDSGEGRVLGAAIGSVLALPDRGLARSALWLKATRRLQRWPAQVTPPGADGWLDTYDSICAISEFSRTWIRRYWRRDSGLLYPPVDVAAVNPGPKRNVILTVGRFFAGSHNKKHIPMIRTFKRMIGNGLDGWEYHLVGGLAPGAVHEDYLRAVRREAAGYPVFVHTDMPLRELVKLYSESKVYWHGTGYGEDENKHPVRFEHFGITTVEAMAAGCVPVVIGKAGQLEVVEHGINGFLWRTLDELAGHTHAVASDEDLRTRLAAAAVTRSRDFGHERFAARLAEVLSEVGSKTRPSRR